MARRHISDAQVIETFRRWNISNLRNEHPSWPYEMLSAETGQCEKVCWRAIERAERHDLLEYGVSLRTAWLTDKALATLSPANRDEYLATRDSYLYRRQWPQIVIPMPKNVADELRRLMEAEERQLLYGFSR